MLIYLPIILFIIFGSVDYYVTQMQYNHLEGIKNYYTNVMKIEGTLDYDNQVNMYNTLSQQGFEDITIVIEPDDRIVFRNTEKPADSKMELMIQAKPKLKPFSFGKLLGIKDDEEFYFRVVGRTLSERPIGEN